MPRTRAKIWNEARKRESEDHLGNKLMSFKDVTKLVESDGGSKKKKEDKDASGK